MKPCLPSSSLSLSMLIPGPTVTVRFAWSISWIWFISFTSTRIPCWSGTAPSVSPVPPARGTTGIPSRLASLTTSEICSAEVGSTTALGMWSAQRCRGNGAGTRARLNTADRPVNTWSGPQIAFSSSTTLSRIATAISDLESGRLGDQLEDVQHLDPLRLALLAQRALGPGARGHQDLHPTLKLLGLG